MNRKRLMKTCMAGAMAALLVVDTGVPAAAAGLNDGLQKAAQLSAQPIGADSGNESVAQNGMTSKSVIVKVTFVDESGNNVGGGDFFVDADGDGVFNYSELQLPEGYELVTAGDAFVSQGSFTVTVKKTVSSSIVKVTFVDENGNNVGGGDFFVDADGDGVFNYSELQLPEGYELVTAGDAFVSQGSFTVTVKKTVSSSIVKVTFVDENGNNVGGGDFFVDADGDGVFNYSELQLPEGYELVTAGDAFVSDLWMRTATMLAAATSL